MFWFPDFDFFFYPSDCFLSCFVSPNNPTKNFERFYTFEKPGMILGNLKGYGYLIKTKDGIIAINELDKKDVSFSIGETLRTW